MKNILVKKKTKKGENGTDRLLQIPLMSGLSKQNYIKKENSQGFIFPPVFKHLQYVVWLKYIKKIQVHIHTNLEKGGAF